MTVPPHHAWTLARLIGGQPINGDASELPSTLRLIVNHLAALDPEARMVAWPTIQSTHPYGEALGLAIASVDPSGPPPEGEGAAGLGPPCATLADVRRGIAETRWTWKGWMPSGRLLCMASDPGIGKTRTVLDLARRAYHNMPWPDCQPMTLPAGSVTLWVAGDRQHDELAEAAAAYGLPDDALLFNATPDDPFGGLDLDDPETVAALGERVRSVRPGFLVVDTVGMTTGRNLCRPEEARAYFGPLADLATATGIPILALTHLSKEKEALGRRIIGAARVVWNLTRPDPEGQPDRRRLWVSKTYAVAPPALGVTMGIGGNEYDFTPPSEPEAPRKGGRPPEDREKAITFLVEKLSGGDRKWCELVDEWEAAEGAKGTIFNARKAMEADGRLTIDTSRKPQMAHLNPMESTPEAEGQEPSFP